MKRTRFASLLLALMLGCLCPLRAAELAGNAAPIAPAKSSTPGVELATTLSTVTGVAISPLMGVGAVGAWQYFSASTPQQRARLPWFAQPWFWAPALLIVSLCALKDIFGITVPAVLKKPFDVLETVEHKVSGLVAVGAFVPLLVTMCHSAGTTPPPGLETAAGHGFLAVINGAWLGHLLLVPAMMAVFFVVCLASNAINILILLSPFPIVDAALKLFRFGVLAGLTLMAFMNPWLGAFCSLVIIVIAWLIAGWSLRLTHLGVVFIWDVFTRRAGRFVPEANGNGMFLGRKTLNVPIRTYGKLVREASGNLVFQYRPWLVLPERALPLPAGMHVVGKGLFYSEILRVEGPQTRSVMLLPPRYRSHETELARVYGFAGARDAGLRAAFVWLKDWIGFKAKPQPQIAAA